MTTAATAAPPAGDAMVSLIQTTIGTILGPLVAELAASRQTNERQAERVAELERENGRQAAELEALKAARTSTVTPGGVEAHETAPVPLCPAGACCGRCGRSGWR